MKQLLAIVLALCAASAVASADATLMGRVTDTSDQPVKDATVVVSGPNGVETTVMTDPTGHYVAVVKTAGPHFATFTFGNKHVDARVDLPDNGSATLDAKLEISGEVIEIVDLPKPLQYAKPKFDPLAIPPYSDKATLTDVWTRAWLLLDVDDRGVVTRVKFLVRPGSDLDAIAVKHAFGLRFEPAHDRHGTPARSLVVWPLEWPSYWWMVDHEYPLGRLPNFGLMARMTSRGLVGPGFPPCAEGRPLNFGSIHPALRDCRMPDLSKADAGEPWLERDASVPPPVVAAAPVLDPRQLRDQAIADAHTNRTRAIVSTAVTGALLAGTIVAWTQYGKWSDRVDNDMVQRATLLPPGQLANDQDHAHVWDMALLAGALGTAIGGFTTAYLWDKASAPAFAVRPNGEGVMMSVGGGF